MATEFKIGNRVIMVPVLNLTAVRIIQRQAAAAVDGVPEADPIQLMLEVLSTRLATTAKDPCKQGQDGAETWAELTPDRISDLVEGKAAGDALQVSFRDLLAESGYSPGEPTPERAPASLTPSSTPSSSPSRAKGSKAGIGTR